MVSEVANQVRSDQNLRDVMRAVPASVAVMTVNAGDNPHGATVSAVACLSLEPALMLVCVRRGSHLLRLVSACGEFALSFLTALQVPVAEAFASSDRRNAIRNLKWDSSDSVAAVADAAAVVRCRVIRLVDGGDHEIVIGSVTAASSAGGTPLLRHLGRYCAVGRRIDATTSVLLITAEGGDTHARALRDDDSDQRHPDAVLR